MANEEHLALLRQGVTVWNMWRKAKPDVKPDLFSANLRGFNLRGFNLQEADLEQAILQEADLEQAILQGAKLQRANLEQATLREAYLFRVDLQQASLQKAILQKAKLQEANLLGANLQGANLQGANFRWADLRWANLQQADLQQADLQQADLQQADLQEALLQQADLQQANLQQVQVSKTFFVDVDLSAVQGLDSIKHYGPSIISTGTLYKSKGNFPEVFLRGCGVPSSLIEYLPSLIGAIEPIQYYSCFISYSGKDEGFAKRLHGRMQQENLRVWFAQEHLQGGKQLREQLDEAILVYDKLVLVLSEESMRSNWVTHEIRRAFQKEHAQGKRVLFPIALNEFEALKQWSMPDDDTGRDLAAEVRRYYIPDFSHWKDHDAFEAGFARLLQDLRAAETPLPPRLQPLKRSRRL